MAQAVLALSMRPRSFNSLYGQGKITSSIKAQVASGRIPRCWMFFGDAGTGKTTVARILAQWLQCPHEIAVGAYCKDCGRHPAGVVEINAADLNGIDPIREIAQTSYFSPPIPAIRRVYILDEAQRITKQAQAVLLKPFEEAPKTTAWIICTTEPSEILRPLRSRCMAYAMARLQGATLDEFLKLVAKKAALTRNLDLFRDYCHLSGVSAPRTILYALEKYESGMDPEEAVTSVLGSGVQTLRICQALLKGEWGPIRSELEKAANEDAVTIRAAVLGYLKAILLNRRPTAELKKVASTIDAIASVSIYHDNASMFTQLAAVLWRQVKNY